jgi:hypothetical protein
MLMYGVFTNIWVILGVNVVKYSSTMELWDRTNDGNPIINLLFRGWFMDVYGIG